MSLNKLDKKGFTLIELLVVIAIVSLLSSIVLVSLEGARERARDARRIAEIYQIRDALEAYYASYGKYPDNSDPGDIGCWGNWEAGNVVNGAGDPFIQPLINSGIVGNRLPVEWTNIRDPWNSQCVYRYGKYSNPCCGCSGTYAILYATCETSGCPTNERPSCCTCWGEGAGAGDSYDIVIFLKE